MDVLLTSFGLGMKQRGRPSIFHRMPPFFTGNDFSRFHIDYASLFMFDRIIIDDRSYEKALNLEAGIDEAERLTPSLLEAVKKGAKEYAEILSSLHRSGRVITKNFDEIFTRFEPILVQTTSADMKNPYRWHKPVELAVNEWMQLRERISSGFHHIREDKHEAEA